MLPNTDATHKEDMIDAINKNAFQIAELSAVRNILQQLILLIPKMKNGDFKVLKEYIDKHGTITLDLIHKLSERIKSR